MRNRLKKLLSITLAASLALSMNTVAFAEEITDDAVIVETGDNAAVDEIGASETEAAVDSYAQVDEEAKKSLSDPSADPMTWSKDPKYAKHTYGIYIPELFGDYEYKDMKDGDYVVGDGKTVTRKALTGYDLAADGSAFDEYGIIGLDNGKVAKVSFNCMKISGSTDSYFIYAYGIANEFDYYKAEQNWYKSGIKEGDAEYEAEHDKNYALSNNNYYGMTGGKTADDDPVPAGVFDYSKFTWNEKDAGATSNGNVVFEGAVITWTAGEKAKKNEYVYVNQLKFKNNQFATVSHDAVNGAWLKINNKYQDNTNPKKQPSFYPVLKTKNIKVYDKDTKKEKKNKPDDATKTLVKNFNKVLKNSPIKFEIRRRPMAGTVSDDYLVTGSSWRFTSLLGDGLDFKKDGKLRKAILQFKSVASVKERDVDKDDVDTESKSSSSGIAQVAAYYVTHVLKYKKLKDKYLSDEKLEDKIKNVSKEGENKDLFAKTDAWYKTDTLSGYDTLIMYGVNNMEGVAAFRKKDDASIGKGYYNNNKDVFISSIEE